MKKKNIREIFMYISKQDLKCVYARARLRHGFAKKSHTEHGGFGGGAVRRGGNLIHSLEFILNEYFYAEFFIHCSLQRRRSPAATQAARWPHTQAHAWNVLRTYTL